MRYNKIVEIPLLDVVGVDFDEFIDNLLELCGDPLGMDVLYELIGVNTRNDTLIFTVEYEVEDD